MAEPTANMSQEAACQLAHAVHTTFQRLAKNGKPQAHEYTVLAGIALACEGSGMPSFQVVALGTGTKCMGGSVRSAKGELLHDSHAEVIARRALMLWMHADIRLAMQQHAAAAPMPPSTMQHTDTPTPQPQHGTLTATTQVAQTSSSDVAALNPSTSKACAAPPSAFVYDSCSRGFKLRPGLKVVMYVSQPPCGDASIVVREGIPDQGHYDPSMQPDHTHEPPDPSSALLTTVASKPAMASDGTGDDCIQSAQNQHPAADGAASALHQSAKLRTGAKALKLTIIEGARNGGMVLEHPCQAMAGAVEVPLQEPQEALAIKGPQASVGGPGRASCGQGTEPTLADRPEEAPQAAGAGGCQQGSEAGAGGCQQGSEGQMSAQVKPLVVATVYLPQAGDVEAGQQECGVLRRKPGKGDPTLSLSCSDKLARWSCCGLQGALLSGLLAEPVYLTALVVGMQPEVAEAGADVQQAAHVAVARGVSGRLVGVTEPALLPPYRLSQAAIHLVPPPPDSLGLRPSTQRRKGSGFSMNWVAAPGCWLLADGGRAPRPVSGTVEVTTAAEGFRAGASKAAVTAGKAQSRLCRAALAREAVRSVGLARDAGLTIPNAVVDAASGGVASGQQSQRQQVEQQPQQQPARQQGGAQLEPQCNVSTTRHLPESCVCYPMNDAEGGYTEGGVGRLTYQGLKQRLGGAYVALWQRLQQQQPFRLWIAKPAHLQAFNVNTL